MFDRKEVLKIFYNAYTQFNRKNKVHCFLKLVDQEEFNEIAKKSVLVEDNLKMSIVPLVGALTEHYMEKDVICVSVDVLNEITDNKDFVKAIFMHELYHILFKKKVRENSAEEELMSEERVNKQIAKDFPKLARYLD